MATETTPAQQPTAPPDTSAGDCSATREEALAEVAALQSFIARVRGELTRNLGQSQTGVSWSCSEMMFEASGGRWLTKPDLRWPHGAGSGRPNI